MINFSIDENSIIAGGLSFLGGLFRVILGIDKDIHIFKQFVFIFIISMPGGLLAHHLVLSYGYEAWAFPAGFFFSIMVLSLCINLARHGGTVVWAKITNRFK